MSARRFLALWLAVGAAAVSAAACGRPTDAVSSELKRHLASRRPSNVTPAIWTAVEEFYKQREWSPAWVTDEAPSKRVTSAIRVLSSAEAHGLDAADYGTALLTRRNTELAAITDAAERARELAAFDARLTTALLTLGRDVSIGRASPAGIDRRPRSRRKSPDLAATLATALDGKLQDWLLTIQPPHPEYAALQKALADLRGVRDRGGWPAVPGGTLKPGASNASVVALRQRLTATGELQETKRRGNAASSRYDAHVEAAVRSFQEHHGLDATGVVSPATAAAMNVTVDDRIAQIALNLERWRSMPDDLGSRHFIVNIPSFHVVAREHGTPVFDSRVVVGKPGNETPVFSSEMTTVVFSPYWNIPDTIAAGETAPAVARDAGYLARNNIEILRVRTSGTERVDPSSVNWDDPDALKELAFRQRPGSDNALGHVKFVFPNPYNVYLHDTPADRLFERRGRAFSHGCVRVEQPEALASYVLRGDPDWDQPRIVEAMNRGVEKAVKLREPIPVHIVYFTAWVDANGGIQFRPDIYGYDRRN
jgi:L,D-transpeptidase YcbB